MRRSGCNEPPIDPVPCSTGRKIRSYVPYFCRRHERAATPTALVTPLRRCHACPWRSAPGIAMPISTVIFSASPISPPPTALVTPLRRCHACPWRSAPGVAMSVSTAIRLRCRADEAPERSGMRAGRGAVARERCHEMKTSRDR
jgi:hypothetical protein